MIKIVNISNLPITINTDKNNFAPLEISAKLSTGPSEPIEGPTFPKAVAIAPNDVLKGVGSSTKKNDMMNTPKPKRIK